MGRSAERRGLAGDGASHRRQTASTRSAIAQACDCTHRSAAGRQAKATCQQFVTLFTAMLYPVLEICGAAAAAADITE
jgi:hypothetical protein